MFIARERNDFVAFLQDAPGQRQDPGAGIGERYAPRLALDQLHAQIVFQLFQLRRQRGLADEAALGRTRGLSCVNALKRARPYLPKQRADA